MDAFAKMLHVFEMLHPEDVENTEINLAFDFAHDFGANFEFFHGIGFFDSDTSEAGAFFFFAHATDFVDEIFV